MLNKLDLDRICLVSLSFSNTNLQFFTDLCKLNFDSKYYKSECCIYFNTFKQLPLYQLHEKKVFSKNQIRH